MHVRVQNFKLKEQKKFFGFVEIAKYFFSQLLALKLTMQTAQNRDAKLEVDTFFPINTTVQLLAGKKDCYKIFTP